MMLINKLKKSLVVRKKNVENTTSNPADELAKMVLNEVTDSEKVELTLTTMPKIHQGRYEAANDMQKGAKAI